MMKFEYPAGTKRLSFWEIACRVSGQNMTDSMPTNETVDALRELSAMVKSGIGNTTLPVVFDSPKGHTSFLRALSGGSASEEVDWSRFKYLMVRREDWERYHEAATAAELKAAPAAKVEAVPVVQALPDATPTPKRVRGKWTDDELRTLWNESLASGATQTSLAKKYGMSRTAIKKHLDTAEEKFSSKAKARGKWGI